MLKAIILSLIAASTLATVAVAQPVSNINDQTSTGIHEMPSINDQTAMKKYIDALCTKEIQELEQYYGTLKSWLTFIAFVTSTLGVIVADSRRGSDNEMSGGHQLGIVAGATFLTLGLSSLYKAYKIQQAKERHLERVLALLKPSIERTPTKA